MTDENMETIRYDRRTTKVSDLQNYGLSIDLPTLLQPPISSCKNLLAGSPRGTSALEIGPGMGANEKFLLELGSEVCATDISYKSLEALVNKFAKHDSFSAEAADMERLPFSDNTFSVVVVQTV